MYQPPHYVKNDEDFIRQLIRENPFAVMVSKGERLIATHIPILIEESAPDLLLYGHIANHNEQLRFVKNDAEVLLVFSGPHSYISSSWYNKADISTWNYAAVHVNAKITVQTKEELVDSLKKLVFRFERDQENPLFYDDIPADLLESHLPEITGFWLKPIKIEAISKMSQNQSSENITSILDHLKQQKNDGEEICAFIRKENEK